MHTQGSGRVLTILDHIRMVEEKLKKKQDEADMREQQEGCIVNLAIKVTHLVSNL